VEVDMVYFLASLAGAVGAFGGWLLTGAIIAFFAATFGLPGPDSASSIFNVLGPIGGIAGLFAAVATVLRLKGGFRARGELVRRGVYTILFIGVAAAGAFHLGSSAIAHLGVNPQPPAVAFEIRLPQLTLTDAQRSEAQVELHTDRNQAVANLSGKWSMSDDGRPVLSGSVPIAYATTQRTVILNMPGEPSRLFRLRLAPNPTQSESFSPWHQVDFIDNGTAMPERARPDAGFAIRYRVL
jgi:hypothetical protein